MGKNGKSETKEPENLTDGVYKGRETETHEGWEYEERNAPSDNPIEKILEFPARTDMAGVFARANFKNDRQRIAAVRLYYRNMKFKDDDHQEMLRAHCASTIGMGALGKVLQAQVGTQLLAPDMIRAALGLPRRHKDKDEIYRRSDFKGESGREKEITQQ